MKGKIIKLLAMVFVVTLLAGNILGASAAGSTISVGFDKKGAFATMGDIDRDEMLASNDLVMMKRILLGIGGIESKYADANNDGGVNIIDLIRLKKDIGAAKIPAQTLNGALVINGTAYYTGEFVSLLDAEKEYQISYDYSNSSGIEIKLNGVAAKDKSFASGTGKGTKYHVFKTGSTLDENSGLELVLSGKGTIDNIVISEIDSGWIDSDNKEQGANDIF